MCLKFLDFIDEVKVVTYRELRIYRKANVDGYEVLKRIKDTGGLDAFTKYADEFILHMDEEIVEFMKAFDYGLSFYMKKSNGDLLDPAGNIIFRGNKYDMKLYLQTRMLEATEFWDDKLAQFWDEISQSQTFDETKSVLNEMGFTIKASDTGFGPDFRLTPEYLFKKNGVTYGDIKIVMTGSRKLDYELAFKNAGLSPSDITSGSYTWHHLDDFNPETGECTMQLVQTVIHSQVEHAGGVSMWKIFYSFSDYAD